MKYFFFAAVLLVSLAGCRKTEDPTPAPQSQPATSAPAVITLVGKWAQTSQTITDGTTTNTSTYKPGEYTAEFTATDYILYGDGKAFYQYPYTLTNTLIHVASANGVGGNDFTITALTATALTLTCPGPTKNGVTSLCTNIYVRQ